MIKLEFTVPRLPSAQVVAFKVLGSAMADLGVKIPLKNSWEQEIVGTTSTGGSCWILIQESPEHRGVREVSIQLAGRGLSSAVHTLLDAGWRGVIPWVNLTSPGVE